jgi:hypothetical protein
MALAAGVHPGDAATDVADDVDGIPGGDRAMRKDVVEALHRGSLDEATLSRPLTATGYAAPDLR